MYDQKLKDEILHLLKEKTIKEVSTQFNISTTTLYRWQKIKEDSKLIKKLISEERYDEALEITKKYPNNIPIQSQLMTIYTKKGEYEKAMEIVQNFPTNAPIQGQLMMIYMKKGEYTKAIEIAQNFPTNAPIQSQLMTVHIKIREYEKAMEIAQNFLDYAPIQGQLMMIYMKKNEYTEAIEIAQNFPTNAPIQGQLMTVYIKTREYEKAMEIAQNFPTNAPIQGQLMMIYMKKGEYTKAIEIAQKFPTNAPIQSQLMTVYIKIREYEKVMEIAQNFPTDVLIQSQLMMIYIKKDEYPKAIEIAKEFPINAPIQSQIMTVYIKIREYGKAMEIAQNFPTDIPIQSQLMTVYIKIREYDKALEIARKFPNNNIIQSQLMIIYKIKREYEKVISIAKKYPDNNIIQNRLIDIPEEIIEDEKIIKNPTEISNLYKAVIQTKNQNFPKEIFEIRNKISTGIISVQDLDTLEKIKDQIGLEKYLLIKIAIYEKLGLINICKTLLKQDKNLDDKIKKQLRIQFEKKNKFYNLEKWDTLIGWFSELEKVEKEPRQEYLKDKKIVTKDLSMKKSSVPVTKEQIDKEIIKTPNNKDKKIKKVIRITPSKIGIEKKKQNTKNKDKVKTLNDMLNQTYKEMILNLKIKYYKEMHDLEKRQAAIYKYDRLEDILSSEPNIRNFDLLLLMLIGDGDNRLKLEQSLPKQYNDEYKKVLSRINSKRKY